MSEDQMKKAIENFRNDLKRDVVLELAKSFDGKSNMNLDILLDKLSRLDSPENGGNGVLSGMLVLLASILDDDIANTPEVADTIKDMQARDIASDDIFDKLIKAKAGKFKSKNDGVQSAIGKIINNKGLSPKEMMDKLTAEDGDHKTDDESEDGPSLEEINALLDDIPGDTPQVKSWFDEEEKGPVSDDLRERLRKLKDKLKKEEDDEEEE